MPPTPTRRPPRPSHSASSSCSATCARSALICLPFVLSPGRKRSVMRTAPSGHERKSLASRLSTRHELHRATAEVERDAVGQRRRVDRRQVAVARLLLAREHAHLEAGPLARGVQEPALVGGVADRGGRDRLDVLDAGRAAEVRVELERLQRALHRLVGERAVLVLAGGDPHRLVDLVRAPPPRAAGLVRLGVAEHDEPERVRPEVDDRELRRPAHPRGQLVSISSMR